MGNKMKKNDNEFYVIVDNKTGMYLSSFRGDFHKKHIQEYMKAFPPERYARHVADVEGYNEMVEETRRHVHKRNLAKRLSHARHYSSYGRARATCPTWQNEERELESWYTTGVVSIKKFVAIEVENE